MDELFNDIENYYILTKKNISAKKFIRYKIKTLNLQLNKLKRNDLNDTNLYYYLESKLKRYKKMKKLSNKKLKELNKRLLKDFLNLTILNNIDCSTKINLQESDPGNHCTTRKE